MVIMHNCIQVAITFELDVFKSVCMYQGACTDTLVRFYGSATVVAVRYGSL